MPQAVSVQDGKLTEVFVVELGVYKKVSGFYNELKQNKNLLRVGVKQIEVLTSGWYRIKNARPTFRVAGTTFNLSTINTYVTGPFA